MHILSAVRAAEAVDASNEHLCILRRVSNDQPGTEYRTAAVAQIRNLDRDGSLLPVNFRTFVDFDSLIRHGTKYSGPRRIAQFGEK